MNVFRSWALGYLDRDENPPHIVKSNKDQSSTFVAFSRHDLPYEFTIAEDPDTELRDIWWAIVKDTKGMYASGHAAAVGWARAALELEQ
jgi:hypothetical protein